MNADLMQAGRRKEVASQAQGQSVGNKVALRAPYVGIFSMAFRIDATAGIGLKRQIVGIPRQRLRGRS